MLERFPLVHDAILIVVRVTLPGALHVHVPQRNLGTVLLCVLRRVLVLAARIVHKNPHARRADPESANYKLNLIVKHFMFVADDLKCAWVHIAHVAQHPAHVVGVVARYDRVDNVVFEYVFHKCIKKPAQSKHVALLLHSGHTNLVHDLVARLARYLFATRGGQAVEREVPVEKDYALACESPHKPHHHKRRHNKISAGGELKLRGGGHV